MGTTEATDLACDDGFTGVLETKGKKMFTSTHKIGTGSLVVGLMLAATASVFAGNSAAAAATVGPQSQGDKLIVVFDRGVSDADQAQAIKDAGAQAVGELPLINGAVVDVGSPSERTSALGELKLADGVRYAEPDGKLRALSPQSNPLAVPSDPMFGQLWGMTKISAPAAWDKYSGGAVTVAVTDTGIDASHPDLDGNLWVNPQETPGNGVDDDKNGIVDDVNGANFSDGSTSGNPRDGRGHGTHVSGTIAAEAGNGVGVVGVNPNAKILAAKFLSDSGSGSTSDAIRAIDYSRSKGAKIMNASWGGGAQSQALEDAIARSGMLFVAAAGNDGSDNESDPHFPSSYELDNVLSVAASTPSDYLASFSNYGNCSVDLAAPGTDIVSSIPGGGFDSYDGTSMATPHVAGAAALIAARNPGLSPVEIKARLMDSVDKIPGMTGRTMTGGRLNVSKALDSKASKPPVGCPPKPRPPVNTAVPTISGNAKVGDTLTANPGTWNGEPTSTEYLWFKCESTDTDTCESIDEATSSTYVPTTDDVGSYLAVKVFATNNLGSGTANSEPYGPVAKRPAELTLTGQTLRNVVRSGRIGFGASCNVDPCQARFSVNVVARKGAKGSKRGGKPKVIARRSSAGEMGSGARRAAVKLSASQRKGLAKSLKQGRVVTAVITGYATDGDGDAGPKVTKEIRIRR